MPPEAAFVPPAASGRTGIGISADWQGPLLRLAVAWIALLAVFAADWLAMADQWWNISTYNHALLVPLILGWLVWQRAPELARIAPGTWWPGLAAFALAALLWVLGAFAELNLVRQTGALAMLMGAVLVLLGPRVSAALAFPIGYSIFLVPFGEELVPPLQMITAAITIALVRASDIPARIDGVFIDTPAGLFEVAEACSGVKFLIAMIAFGVLVANVCFVGWRRRAAFLALCVVVPIIANGIRAWGTIAVAQVKGAAYAGGFDHIVYGWLFFALVIALIVALAWRFFDRPVHEPVIDVAAISASPLLARLERLRIAPAAALLVMAALVLGARGWALAAEQLAAPLPARIDLPAVRGWTRVDYAPRHWWEPRAAGADHRLLGRYADAGGRHVDVFFALYAAQREGAEASGFGEGALRPGSGWSWQSAGRPAAGANVDRLLSDSGVGRIAETRFRVGGMTTGSPLRLKLAIMADRLLLRERPAAMLILSAEDGPGQSDAGAALVDFRTATGPIDTWMDRVAGLR